MAASATNKMVNIWFEFPVLYLPNRWRSTYELTAAKANFVAGRHVKMERRWRPNRKVIVIFDNYAFPGACPRKLDSFIGSGWPRDKEDVNRVAATFVPRGNERSGRHTDNTPHCIDW